MTMPKTKTILIPTMQIRTLPHPPGAVQWEHSSIVNFPHVCINRPRERVNAEGIFLDVARSHSKILVACMKQAWKYLSTERVYAVARSEHAACRSIASPSAKSSSQLPDSFMG